MFKFLLLLSLICSCAYSLPFPYHYSKIDNDGLITSEITNDNPEDMKWWAKLPDILDDSKQHTDEMVKRDLDKYAIKNSKKR